MKRPRFTINLVFGIMLLCLTMQQGYGQADHSQSARPNILFIISDDHGYQAVSAYKSKLAVTPNIDRIAREGAIFQNSFVTNSLCGPSRATLLTGKYSHLNGYKANEGKFDASQQTFARLLQKSQYQTAWIGKWHLGSLPVGFDYFNILVGQGNYYNPDLIRTGNDTINYMGYVTDIITKSSLDWLDKRDTSKPFCLVVGEKATHREWLPDLQDLGAYDQTDFTPPVTFKDDYKGRLAAQGQDMTIAKTMRLKEDLKVHLDYTSGDYARMTADQRKIYEEYYGRISRQFDSLQLSGDALTLWKYQRYLKDYLAVARSLDRNIGTILDYLDKKGLSANTVVVYVSDQGFYMGEHGWFDKRFMYEESMRTPFVMRYPGVIKPGTSIHPFVLNIDWAPTILDIAGVAAPGDMQGVSLLPLLRKKDSLVFTRKDEAYYHYYEYPEPHHVMPHFGLRTGTYKLIRFYGPADSWELFDLSSDPIEVNNLYGKKGYEKITATLKDRLVKLIRQYQDEDALKILNTAVIQ